MYIYIIVLFVAVNALIIINKTKKKKKKRKSGAILYENCQLKSCWLQRNLIDVSRIFLLPKAIIICATARNYEFSLRRLNLVWYTHPFSNMNP